MPNEDGTPTAEEIKNGAPPTGEASKGTPHHVAARLAGLDAETRELVERAIADKVILERNLKTANERVSKTEGKLNEILVKEQDAEKKRLEEQGNYKALAETAQRELEALRHETARRTLSDTVSRELIKAGALDEELVAAGLLSKYSDELKSDNAASIVSRLKEEKPLLFKKEVAESETQEETKQDAAPQTRSTGQAGSPPPPGANPSQFNALDKKHSSAEVEKMWQQATKNATF